jgi:hypothetical protein
VHATATGGQACGAVGWPLGLSGHLVERASAGPKELTGLGSDEGHRRPASSQHGIALLRVLRVNAWRCWRDHAQATLAAGFDQGDGRLAILACGADEALGEHRAGPPLDTEVAVMASPRGGSLTGQAMQQCKRALCGQACHEGVVDISVVEIQNL